MSPEEIIQAQVVAYNNRDIEAFTALHSPTAQLFNLPTGELICEGANSIRERYSKRFENPNLHAEIINRIVHGSRVIDHEHITGMTPERVVQAVAIYEVENELIQRVWFIFD
ncbi:MAG: nuclear transport factor 2 family protein [Phototrophicaceae bacterium]